MINTYTTVNDISHITCTTVIDTSHDYYVNYGKRLSHDYYVHYSKRHVT